MRSEFLIVVILAATSYVGVSGETSPLDAPDLPNRIGPQVNDPVLDAARVWRLGPSYLDGVAGALKQPDFAGKALAYTRSFLSSPHLRPVVQFSCARSPTEAEDFFSARLVDSAHPMIQLQALVALMIVEAPGSVKAQWSALQALKRLDRKETLWLPLIAELEDRFSEERVSKVIAKAPPMDQYEREPRRYFWAIRAAGVRRLKSALDRLKELSRSEQLYTSLAAECSLSEFPGADGDEALAHCMTGWRYNAANKAGYALAKRNPKLLLKTLLNTEIPESFRWQAGLLLAQCDCPEAVPLLCEAVGNRALIDGEMFRQIERLATRAHLDILTALPGKVRPEQRKLAEAALAKLRERLKTKKGADTE